MNVWSTIGKYFIRRLHVAFPRRVRAQELPDKSLNPFYGEFVQGQSTSFSVWLCLCYNRLGEETHDAVRNTAAQVSFYSHQQQDINPLPANMENMVSS